MITGAHGSEPQLFSVVFSNLFVSPLQFRNALFGGATVLTQQMIVKIRLYPQYNCSLSTYLDRTENPLSRSSIVCSSKYNEVERIANNTVWIVV